MDVETRTRSVIPIFLLQIDEMILQDVCEPAYFIAFFNTCSSNDVASNTISLLALFFTRLFLKCTTRCLLRSMMQIRSFLKDLISNKKLVEISRFHLQFAYGLVVLPSQTDLASSAPFPFLKNLTCLLDALQNSLLSWCVFCPGYSECHALQSEMRECIQHSNWRYSLCRCTILKYKWSWARKYTARCKTFPTLTSWTWSMFSASKCLCCVSWSWKHH